jgi:hypothetical protein
MGIVIEEKARMYVIKHNTGPYEHECNTQPPLKEWSNPARRLNIPETSASILYSTEIYIDGSKIGGKDGAGVAIYVDQVLNKQC